MPLSAGSAEDLEEAFHKQEVGLDFLRDGRIKEACQFLTWAVELAPEAWEPRFNLSRCLDASGASLEERLKHLRKAAKLAPGTFVVQYTLARTLEDGGHLEEAIGAYRLALEKEPGVLELRLALSRLLAKSGRRDAAIAILRPVPEDHPMVLARLARLYREGRLVADEEAVLRRMLSLVPNPAPFAARLGEILIDQGRTGEAEAIAVWLRQWLGVGGQPRDGIRVQSSSN